MESGGFDCAEQDLRSRHQAICKGRECINKFACDEMASQATSALPHCATRTLSWTWVVQILLPHLSLCERVRHTLLLGNTKRLCSCGIDGLGMGQPICKFACELDMSGEV